MFDACLKLWNCFKYENTDITAWLKTTTSRAPTTIVVALFSASALIFIAGELKDCTDDNVDLGLFSLQVSSVLAVAQVIENVVNLFLAPFLGALADSSSHRKILIIGSSVIWVGSFGLGGMLLFAKPSLGILWSYIITLVVTSIFYELSLLLVFAYLPEICHDMDELTAITSRQYAIVNGGQLVTAVVLGGISIVLDSSLDDPLLISAFAHFVVVAWFLYYGIPGIYHLPKQKPSEVSEAEGGHVCSQLYLTAQEIKVKYPQVGWFLVSWTFLFAGVIAVTALQVAYTTDELGFEVSDIAVLGALLLFFSIIGAGLCEVLAKYYRLKSILMITLVLWSFITLLSPWVIRGEDILGQNSTEDTQVDDNGCPIDPIEREPDGLAGFMVYFVSILYGLGIGFVYPTTTAIFSMIIPGGEEATYFGLKTFCSKLLAWAPAAVFALINESTEDLQLAFMSIGIWFVASLPFMYFVDVDQGIADVKDTLHKREGAGSLLYGESPLKESQVKDEESKVLSTLNPVHAAVEYIEGEEKA